MENLVYVCSTNKKKTMRTSLLVVLLVFHPKNSQIGIFIIGKISIRPTSPILSFFVTLMSRSLPLTTYSSMSFVVSRCHIPYILSRCHKVRAPDELLKTSTQPPYGTAKCNGSEVELEIQLNGSWSDSGVAYLNLKT